MENTSNSTFSIYINMFLYAAAKHKELKQIGSFHCLNGKVDLSTFEAINTLDEWETKYNKWVGYQV